MNLKVGGTCQVRSAGNFLSCLSTVLAIKVQIVVLVSAFVVVSTIWSRVFFVLILLVPWPVICKRGARAPCHIWSRRHFPWDGGTVSHYNSHSIWMHSVTRTTCIFPVFALKVMHAVILLTRFCKLLTRVALMSGGHVPQVPQCHNASALTPQKVERA